MASHEIEYEVFGDDLQHVEVALDPGETVIAEAGGMLWMEEGIAFEAKMGDGSSPDQGFLGKLASAAGRAISGESLFLTHFTNEASDTRRVAFAAPYPGKIDAIDLNEVGGTIICQKEAFLCAAMGTELSVEFHKRFGAGFFGGEGFILQRLRGEGIAILHAGGHTVTRKLQGEKLRVDTGCLVAFTEGIDYSIEKAGDMKSMFFGGEGLFLATLQGEGTVILQSLPFGRLAQRINSHASEQSGD